MKTEEELDDLKSNWSKDPWWEIEDTEGFQDHREELLAWRKDLNKKHKIARKVIDELRCEHVMDKTGVSDKNIALHLQTFEEIRDEVEYGVREKNGLRVQAALVRATLLQAAQLKRIADALENIDDGNNLSTTAAIWGSEK